jgi:hypothetical protein
MDVIEHSRGAIGMYSGIKKAIIKKRGLTELDITPIERAAIKREAQAEYLTVIFLFNADRASYKTWRTISCRDRIIIPRQSKQPTMY